MSSTAVLVPIGITDEWRRRARDFVVEWYARELPDIELVLGSCAEGPWSKGAALADALSRTSAELLVVADADSFVTDPEILRAALQLVDAGEAPWVVPHRAVYRLRDRETARLYDEPRTAPRLGWTCRPVYEGPAGGGIFVVPRETYEAVGGIDSRFLGWGGEDISLGWAIDTLVGAHRRLDGKLVHLWHPHPAPNLRGSEASEELVARYAEARGVRRRMAAVIAGEQWTPAPPLPEPIRFRMTANRNTLRLPSGPVIRFTNRIFETADPDTVEQIRHFPIVREEPRR